MATPSKIDFRKQIKKHQNASLLNDENNGKQVVGEIIAIPKNDLYADDNQVRKHFSPESLEEMRVSLENQDQIQPIVVWPLDSKGYKIQKGERRWRGAMLSDKVTHLQCIIKKTSSTLEQLAENLAAADWVERLTPDIRATLDAIQPAAPESG